MRHQNGLSQTVAQLRQKTFKRVLGVFDLFAIGYGDLGSSIYYALGITALFALGSTPIAIGLAGLVFICTALTYAELTSVIHSESGGSASFSRHAFNDLISFIAGWGLLLDYIVTIAISAFAVAPYLGYFFNDLLLRPVQIAFTVVLIFLLFLMNVIGVRHSTRISLVLTAFTILVQAVIIIIGISTVLDLPFILDHMRINVPDVNWSPTWDQFLKGTAMAMVAYTGIESIAQLASEAKHPVKTVPRATLLTMFVLIVVYIGISVVSLSAVTPQELGTKYLLNPIAGIVDSLPFGKMILSPIVALLATVVLTVAANAGLIGASRLSFNMGEYYQLPRFFYKVHPRFKTPIVSLAFFAILTSLVVIASRGRIDFLADLYNFGAMIAFFFTHLSLIVLRIKKPEMKRPFKVPFNIPFGKFQIPITAVIGAIATFCVWCLIIFTKPEGRYLGIAWMTFGIIMYYRYRKKRNIEPGGRISIEQVSIPGYKPIEIRKILVPTRGGSQTETVQMACEVAKFHRAKITALQVIEIAASIPLDAPLLENIEESKAILKRAEAIAREYHVEVELKIIRSRSLADTIIELAHQEGYDLIILGAIRTSKDKNTNTLGSFVEKVVREAPCRVWVCATHANSKRSLKSKSSLSTSS